MFELNYIISTILIISGVILLNIAYYSFKKRDITGSFAFALLLVSGSFHTIGYAFELLSTDTETMMFWIRVEYIGCSFYSFLAFYFAREYTDEKVFANKKLLSFILGINIVTLILVYTNEYHFIFYSSVGVDNTFSFPILASEKGLWYKVHIGFIYFSYVYLIVTFLRHLLKTHSKYRHKAGIMLLSSLITIGVSLVYLLGFGPKYFDLVPFGLFLSAITFAIGLFKYNILNLIPITYQHVFNNIDEGVILLDNDYRLVNSNPSVCLLIPKINKYAIGNDITNLIKHCKIDLNNSNEQIVYLNINKDDRIYSVKNSVVTSTKFLKVGYMIVIKDITEEQSAIKRLSKFATIDTLTEVYNRRYFLELCEIYFKDDKLSSSKFLLLLDIDFFKKINDLHGHQVGDEVLNRFGELLKETFERCGFVGRYGGEEFMALLFDIDKEEAIMLADYFREIIYQKLIVEFNIRITVSIGVHHSSDETLNEAIKKADDLLYRAKENGRNRIEF